MGEPLARSSLFGFFQILAEAFLYAHVFKFFRIKDFAALNAFNKLIVIGAGNYAHCRMLAGLCHASQIAPKCDVSNRNCRGMFTIFCLRRIRVNSTK